MCRTTTEEPSPLCCFESGVTDGYFLNSGTWGTYIHGIFDNNCVVSYILEQSGASGSFDFDFKKFREENFDKLASLVRNNSEMDYIYKSMRYD